MANQIQLRRGLAALWTSVNPVLADGEIGVETDTEKFKRGNGVTAWVGLAYIGSSAWGEITGALADQTDLQTALNLKQSTSEKGAANGYASLDGAGTVPDAQIGPIGDTTPSRGTFTDVRIVQTAPTIAAGVLTLNLGLSNVFTASLNQNITSMVISNVAPVGRMSSFQLMFTADGTARAVVYMSGIVWAGAVAPTLTSALNKRDWLQFETFDGGSTWFGFVLGQNF